MRAKPYLYLLLLTASVLLLSCTDNSANIMIGDTRESSSTVMTFLVAIFVLFIALALFVLPLIHSSWGEFVAISVIVMLLLFYYTSVITHAITRVSDMTELGFLDSVLSSFARLMLNAQHSILTNLPQETITIGDTTIFKLTVRDSFTTTRWPLLILLTGGMIRIAVARYVNNRSLRHITGEYWIYILAYLILAYVISAITELNFFALIGVFLITFVIIALGLFHVLKDALKGIFNILVDIWMTIRIAAKTVVYLVTIITEFVKHFGSKIRYLYDSYIVQPLHQINAQIVKFLDNIEKWLDERLGRSPKSKG